MLIGTTFKTIFDPAWSFSSQLVVCSIVNEQ